MSQQPRVSGDGASFLQRMGEEASLLGHGVVKMLSPQSLLAGLKTLMWLVPLTLLIWIYAEQGQKKDSPGEVIPIGIRSNDPKVYVELRMPNEEAAVTADLSGPAGQLDDVHRKIQPGDAQQTVPLTVPASLSPGLHDLDVAQLLLANPIFAGSNVQVGKCTPARINVFVDPIEERELEVKKPDTLKNIDTAIFEPAKITVRAPSEVFKHSTKLEAQLSEATNVGKSGEQHAKVHVKLADLLPNQARSVTYVDTDTVQATYTVKENAEAKFTYPYIQILTLGPSVLLSRYDVICDQDKDTLANVTVIGPAEKIDALRKTSETRPEELPKPRAILEVKGEDRLLAGQSSRPRQLKFDQLPDTSIRISPDDEKRDVSFRIVDRTASQ